MADCPLVHLAAFERLRHRFRIDVSLLRLLEREPVGRAPALAGQRVRDQRSIVGTASEFSFCAAKPKAPSETSCKRRDSGGLPRPVPNPKNLAPRALLCIAVCRHSRRPLVSWL